MHRKIPYITAALLWLLLISVRVGAAWSEPSPTASPFAPSAHPTTTASPTSTPATHPTVKPTATPVPEPPSLQSAVSAMSKVQALIEFYYMNTGTYPVNLDELTTQYNNNIPKNGVRVAVPFDPATNKPFVYQLGDDTKSYLIKVPNPDAYGVKSLELTNIDWGWMRAVAEEHQKRQLAELCGIYIKGLADALDHYAQDNKNQLPDSLDALVPKYVKKLPNCPADNKPFVYKKTDRGYTVACPDPKAHGLEVLEYSSTEGFKSR